MAVAAIRQPVVSFSAIVAFCILLAAAPVTASTPVPSFSATYDVRYGILSGTMTLQLSPIETGYLYETSLRPNGVAAWLRRGAISERTTLVDMDGRILPLDYYSRDTIARPSRETTYAFDPGNGRVTGQYKTHAIDAGMPDNGQNRISVHIAIMSSLLAATDIPDYSVFDRGRWRHYRFEVIRDQDVEISAGKFETVEIRYSSADSAKSWSMHFAPALNYLPVVLDFDERGKLKSRAQLTEYRLDPAEHVERQPASEPAPGRF